MTEPLPSVEEVFADALRALAAAGDAVVAIGGWAVRLLREHPLARPLPHAPLFTTDLDVALGRHDPALGDLPYLAELVSMFADEMGTLRALASEHVEPALHRSEKTRIRRRLDTLAATSDVVLAAAAEARATGRTEWADRENLAALVQAGAGGLFEA